MSEKKGKSELFGWYVFAAALVVILVVESLLLIGILNSRCDHRTPYPQNLKASPHKSFPSHTLFPSESPNKASINNIRMSPPCHKDSKKIPATFRIRLEGDIPYKNFERVVFDTIEIRGEDLIKTRLEADRDSLSFMFAIECLSSGYCEDSVSCDLKNRVYLLEDFSR